VPVAIWQYPVYSIRLVLHRRRINHQLEALDLALREAVRTRDEALATLGQITLAGDTRTGRIAAFAEPLTGLDAERAAIERRREALTIELAAAEADRRARLADLDARLEGLEAELGPLERALEDHRQRRDALEREAESADDLRRSLETRRAHIERDVDADATTRALYDEELHEIESGLAALELSEPTQVAARAALDAPFARLDGQVSALTRLREAVAAQRAVWLEEADGRIAELSASRDDELSALERSDARRRGALVDLGREALNHEAHDRPGYEARQALEHIVELRRARKALQSQYASLQTRPLNLTVATLIVLVLTGLLLRGC